MNPTNPYPCDLRPPLRAAWTVQFEESLLDLPFFGSDRIFLREPNRTLAAYDESRENRIWVYPHTGWLKAMVDGLLFYAGEDERLHVVEAETGRPLSVSPCPVEYDVIVQDGVLVNKGTSSISGIEPLTGRLVWEYIPENDPGFTTELFGMSDRVIIGVRDGTVRALSVQDGSEIWRHTVRDLPWRNQGKANIPGTAIGMGSIWGNEFLIRVTHEYVISCSLQTGHRSWTWRSESVSAAAGGSASLYGDRYYLTGANGSYHVIETSSGATILEKQLSDSLPKKAKTAWGWLPILVSETHLFVGSHDGTILAFERDSGQYAWSHYPKGGGGVTKYFVSRNRRFYYSDFSFRLYCLEEVRAV